MSVTMLAVLAALVALTTGAINPPIPVLAPQPGLLLGNGSRASKVVLEAFLETNCPDSGRAWPELNKLAEHYPNGNVAVIVHQVPLPYHRNSIVCTKGLRSIQSLMPKKVNDYITAIYDNGLFLSNGLTASLNDNQVVELVASIAASSTGVDQDTFKADINNHTGYVVYAWKYATRRGVAGTPWYMLNGVDVGANPSTLITKDEWIEYIDGLLG